MSHIAPTVPPRALETAANRAAAAARAWWCELLCLLLTILYCAILAHDIAHGSAADRISSPSWFSQGFCNSWADRTLDSHSLCFLGDLLGGGTLVWENWRRYKKSRRQCLQVAMAVSVFTVLHGLGHLMIGHFLERDFMASVRPWNLSWSVAVLYYVLSATFLAMGPFLGYCNGVSGYRCVAAHLVSAWAFLALVPTQFAFGFVQLYLNAWYCTPRVLFLGSRTVEEVSRRVDDGWAVVSFGFLALMPVVFAEMLACDSFVMAVSGHFLYDGSIVLISLAYSVTLWRLESGSKTPKKASCCAADEKNRRKIL